MSRDPIGNWGDSGNLGNGYAYVGNSPWQYTDPYGLCPSCFGAVVGAAAGALWQFGSYSYRVASTDATWDNQALSDDLKFGLLAGAVIGSTGGLGASITGAVTAGGAGAGTVFGATLAVGAAEGVVGQAAFDFLDDGSFNDGLQAYAGAAAFGAATAGAGYGAGALWKAGRGAHGGVTNGASETIDNFGRGAISSPYTRSGTLTNDAVANSFEIELKGGIRNSRVVQQLTSDGSSIDDWGKFATRQWHDSPSGSFQPHFYRNKVSGQVNYEIDYKSVLHPKSMFPLGGGR